MYSIIIFIHATVCVILAVVILMQSGRGGGLTEQFASAESMFGAKTNSFMVKATTVFATIFLAISLVLTIYSSKQEKSIMPAKVAVPTTGTEQPLVEGEEALGAEETITNEPLIPGSEEPIEKSN